jgi:hypothetical protein
MIHLYTALPNIVAPGNNRVREYCRAYRHGGLTYCLSCFATRFMGVVIVESTFLENHVESWWLKKHRWVFQSVVVVTGNLKKPLMEITLKQFRWV